MKDAIKKVISFKSLLFFAKLNFLISQSVYEKSFDYKSKLIFQDSGKMWKDLSSFSKLKNDFIKNKFQKKNIYVGFSNQKEIASDLSISSNENIYAMISLDKKNEIGSGVGYLNNWFNFYIGRGNENWGAGNEIELALSYKSEFYDYMMIASDYGHIRVKYIHGFLEKIDGNNNRYINARAFEYSNKKSLLLGLSEIIIYSGNNRSFDLGYLNPISTHLEVELNNRSNSLGDGFANAVWQLHFDYLLNKYSRLSFNYLIDEFVLDKNIEIGKDHGRAYSLKYVHSLVSSDDVAFNIFTSRVFVGRPTFRHRLGSNNFVNKGKPLGWEYGSNGIQTSLGLNFMKHEKLIISLKFTSLQKGDQTILDNPYYEYIDYTEGEFNFKKEKLITIENQVLLFNNMELYCNLKLRGKSKRDFQVDQLLGFRILIEN